MASALGKWVIERKLRLVTTRLKGVDAEIRELSEQSLTLRDDAADAQGDALIGGPSEAQSARDAQRHLEKATSRLVELNTESQQLRGKQDELLDQMGGGSW